MRFNPAKCKVNLKLSLNRLKLMQQKKTAINAAARREIASLLEKQKEESARIRVEHIILEDYNIEAMEVMELYCELLLARFGLLEEMQHCDPGIVEAVHTLIYAAPRMDIKELCDVRDQLIFKFGKEFAHAAIDNSNNTVNPRIVQKLRIQTPDPMLVTQYLKTIAQAYNIEYVPKPPEFLSMNPNIPVVSFPPTAPTMTSGDLGGMTGSPSIPMPTPDISPVEGEKFQSPVKAAVIPPPEASVPDFDELAKRFEALKQRKQQS